MRTKIFIGTPDKVEEDMNKWFSENSIKILSTTQSSISSKVHICVTLIYRIK